MLNKGLKSTTIKFQMSLLSLKITKSNLLNTSTNFSDDVNTDKIHHLTTNKRNRN